jgi:pSer/pThr/pTyr-binding forkhead associated (FHA) protein
MSEDARPRARLVVKSGRFAGLPYELAADETILGRNPAADITLADEGISREHAVIGWDAAEQAWCIEDLQSTNGTRVNGKRVRSATLQHGDEIQVGRTTLEFHVLGD